MILVTGATGLVGSHLVLQLLLQEQEVVALYRDEANKQRVKKVFDNCQKPTFFEKINWIQGDILDIPSLENAFQNIDSVYHCAALISFDPNDEEKLRKTNIEGTANIVNFCIDYKIKKLCYVSSIAALGDLAAHETIITEETEWNPETHHSDYAISKYGAEMEVWRAYQEDLDVVIVNPGVILGPLFWEEGSGDIYKKIKNGLLFYTNGGTGFVTVNDVVTIMISLMNSSVSGERFTLIAETLAYEKLTKLIAEKQNVKAPKYEVSKWITNLAWKLDWLAGLLGKKRMLSKDMARSLHNIDYYDTSKIEKTLGFEFERINTYIQNQN
ncbi:MAG: NAD-dependent epimerase/dehydratase family protein [Bacteroidota bacterium]